MIRYARLFVVQLRASLLLAMQYRLDFVFDALTSLFWTTTALVPLYVVFNERPNIAGWTFGEALLVVGFFTVLEAVLEGAINPSLGTVVEHIRKGTLDFVLLKPADAQFLVSTSRFLVWRGTNVVTALVIFVYAFRHIGVGPGAGGVLLALAMLVLSILVLYSLWTLVVSAAFFVVRIDNLSHLFSSVFDAARWPTSIFRGALHFVFTFLFPIGLMTTYPAEALLGRLRVETAITATVLTAAFVLLSRRVWSRALRSYSSAGG